MSNENGLRLDALRKTPPSNLSSKTVTSFLTGATELDCNGLYGQHTHEKQPILRIAFRSVLVDKH